MLFMYKFNRARQRFNLALKDAKGIDMRQRQKYV